MTRGIGVIVRAEQLLTDFRDTHLGRIGRGSIAALVAFFGLA